ncbi:hypothetical protein J3F83DRAFT_761514 [Trichoderma novae-zelandiae]
MTVDEEDLLGDLRRTLEKCARGEGDQAKASGAAKGAGTSLQNELECLLAYDDRKWRLGPKKIQLLNAAVDFYKGRKKKKGSKSNTAALDTTCMIIRALCSNNPRMAFEQCPGDDSHEYETGKSNKAPAFESAAESGYKELTEIMLDALLRSFQSEGAADPDTTSPGHPAQERQRETTPPTKEENTREVMELLLKCFAKLKEDDDNLKQKAMTLLDEKTWTTAVTTPSPDVVDYLLKMEDSKFWTSSHALFIVENGTALMWKMFPERSRRQFLSTEECGFLHKAVELGKLDMVEEILKQMPAQIEATWKQQDPLQYLQKLKGSNLKDKDACYNRIRDLLVHAMIRSQNLGIQLIRDILRLSKADEMSFNFPQFKSNTKNEQATDYIRGLQNLTKANPTLFRFEKVLKYAVFPDLSGQAPFLGSADLKQDHREVRDTLGWLEERGVQEVLNLAVDDRLYCPHDDSEVAFCVNKFNVKVLNWKKTDIYLRDMADAPVEELHLYSSGNRSVHDQWAIQLPKLKQLKTLYVYVVEDLLSLSKAEKASKELGERLTKLNEELGCVWKSGIEDVNEILDDGSQMNAEGDYPEAKKEPKIMVSRILWIQQRESIAYRSADNITTDLGGPHLASFIKKFCNHYIESRQPPAKTKVALVDSGVVVVNGVNTNDSKFGSSLAKRIVEGISLVSVDNVEHPWWHATEPHGTQMATIICSINPCCELYVVKVAESNASGITGHNVAKAIEWARKKGVDIISLSLVAFSDPDKEMRNAITAARQDDIVIICSTADEGRIGAHSVGEENREVLSIAACDKYGNLLPQSQKNGFDYQFIGNNIRVGQIPFLKSEESIKGSSVSTAVAAGIASLILACARISPDYRIKHRVRSWRFKAVDKYFRDMSEEKWAVLDNLCGKGKLEGRYVFEQVVKEAFASD